MAESDEAIQQHHSDRFRPLNWPISGVALSHLEQYLYRWRLGSTISVRTILQEVNQGLSETFPARELDNVVENYELMGWIEVDRSTPGGLNIVAVHPLYFEQSRLHRTEQMGTRHHADVTRAKLKQEREQLLTPVAEMGLDLKAEVEELKQTPFLRHRMVVVETIANMASFGYHAFVRHIRDDQLQAAKGRGADESEAICFAAARAYLQRRAREQAAPQPE